MNLLVVAPHYKHFIKEFTEAVSRHTDSINVCVHHNVLSELSCYLPFSHFRHIEKFSKRNLVDLSQIPGAVQVHILSSFYLVPDGKNRSLGDKLFDIYCKYIENHNITFDLIHAHFTWPSGYVGVRLGKKFGVPVVVTIHENRDWFIKEYKLKNSKAHYVWKNANALIRVNKKDLPLLKEFNENTYSIPNGFNDRKIYPMEKNECRDLLNIPLEKKVIFGLGNLIERKGFQFLIQSMKNVVDYRKDVLCIIGGDGPLRDKLQKMIKDLKLEEYVVIAGYIPEDLFNYYLNAADLFVLPSLSEGNPVVMFEALGVGLPFVGTEVGGTPEIITSSEYGLLCPPADVECLAEKILMALDKTWNRDEIKKYGSQFTWQKIADRTYHIYENLLSEVE